MAAPVIVLTRTNAGQTAEFSLADVGLSQDCSKFGAGQTTEKEFANQQQAYGYGIMLNCIFRPLLTVIGLIFSSVIMSVMAQFVDNTFALAADNSGIGTLVDQFAMLAMIALLFYVHYQVVVRSLRVITLLPNAVLDWAGHGSRMNGYDQVFDSEEAHRSVVGVIQNNTIGGGKAIAMAAGRKAAQEKASGSGGGGTPKTPDVGDNKTDDPG